MKNRRNNRKPSGKLVRPIRHAKVEAVNVVPNPNDGGLGLLGIQLEYMFQYGVNLRDRIITISEEITYPMFDIVDAGLSFMESESKQAITVRIKSVGGSCGDALALVGRLKRSKCQIITEGYGEVMSAATLILACGDKRRISRFAVFMWHEASYAMEGRHSQMKATVAELEKEEKQWAQWMSQFSDKDSKFWLTKGIGIDAYFTAEELLEMGVVDEII